MDRPCLSYTLSGGIGMWKRILLALVLLGMWTAFKVHYPDLYTRLDTAVVGFSCRLWDACVTLGAGLGRGEDAVTCLGRWWEAVFLP